METGNVVATLLLVAALVSFGLWATIDTYEYFGPTTEYNKAVHGHVVNAYYAETPELVIENILLAKEGMEKLGLEPQHYSTLHSWKQTPDNKMSFQYDILDSVVSRAEEVITWRNQQQRTGGGDQLNDVYGDKIAKVKSFIYNNAEGWVDDIAQDAHIAQNHSWLWVANHSILTGVWLTIQTLLFVSALITYAGVNDW